MAHIQQLNSGIDASSLSRGFLTAASISLEAPSILVKDQDTRLRSTKQRYTRAKCGTVNIYKMEVLFRYAFWYLEEASEGTSPVSSVFE
ncbi:hypothetical protein IAQ61_000250 [Plenodomus lingam]|uniref:Predicted protein n=1 Tax=Leptosphaeria maculans (strain JN3 / isolate v23.1.3 / race Av1-4-5-6-7-8) TaxID=985895 RepID=E5R586_LEPMJ|nr:predicted protein [Plenodomus lingam JN3]KAH9881524.1 hypothetical protein IAQ61_000250 [Plenodomus lingam]CBX92056.1 predicted protein [Plenodomus lingam JN3]